MKDFTGCKYFNSHLIYLGDESEFISKLNLSLFRSSLSVEDSNMFLLMFEGFRIMHNIKCAYFRVCEYTDGKYTLNVRKDLNNTISIKFKVYPAYTGDRMCL